MTIGSNGWKGATLSNGRYLITAKLGEGGMGTVYRARDQNIDAEVVVKVPRRAMLEEPEFAGRFKREIRSLVTLSHPRIVKVTDVGDWDGLPFAVMQYLPAGSLEDARLAGTDGRPGPCDPRDVPGWLGGIADALDYVHSRGFVHRDVKPGNILFDAQGHSFLSDFGVAKVLTSADGAKSSKTAMTGAGLVLGTPEYMAPELIMGEPFDGRADQYALAVTVYEMLCGRRPFEDDSSTKILVLHTTMPPPPPIALRPALPERLSQVVLKGLAKSPGDRYTSCSAFAATVAAALGDRPGVQEGRVRIKCPSCGRSMSIASSQFTELKQSGRRVSCPGCKSPFHVSGEGTRPDAPGSRTVGSGSGTVILPPPGSPKPKEREDTPRGTPRRSATVVEKAPTTPIEGQRRGATVVERIPGHQPPETPKRSATVAERIPTQPPEVPRRGATVVERVPRPPAPSEEDGDFIDQEEREPGRAEGGKLSPAVLIAAAAAAGGLAAVVLVLVLLRGLGSTREPSPTANRAELPPSTDRLARPEPSREVAIVTKPAPPSKAGGPSNEPATRTPRASTSPASVENSDKSQPFMEAIRSDPAPPNDPTEPPAPGSDVEKPPAVEELPEAAPASDATPRVAKGSVPLEKLLGAPELYANQIVELTRLYCVGQITSPRAGESTIQIIESDLDLAPGHIRVRRGKNFVLEIDPKLTQRVARRERASRKYGPSASESAWSDEVAITTVRVLRQGTAMNAWTCRIVRFEFLTKIDKTVVAAGYKRKLRVGYKTLTMTPDDEAMGEGNTKDWATPTRLWHITNQFQKLFEKQASLQSQAKWDQFNTALNSIIVRGTQAAIRQNAAEQEAVRRQFTPSR